MNVISLGQPSHAGELIRLRWVAISAQLLLILFTYFVFSLSLPVVAIGVVLGTETLLNIIAIWYARHKRPEQPERLALFMVVDLLILTALLFLTGGPYNPFSFLYLVHIALAALVLDSRGTWMLGLFSIACFGSLFLGHLPLPVPDALQVSLHGHQHHTDEAMDMHVQGMWLAFAIAATTITYFLGRVARDLDQRNAQLIEAQTKAYRTEKIAALATLATGAAHELATPLSTIAIISKDLETEVHRLDAPSAVNAQDLADLTADARLIRDQVDRCRTILEQLAVDTGQTLGESDQSFALSELLDEAISLVDTEERLDIDISERLLQTIFLGPQRTLAHAMRALIKNAVQASTGEQRVSVQAYYDGHSLCCEVHDQGRGIPDESLPRVVEPFYSTKSAGQGVGLGLFLAQSVADTLGGTLEIDPGIPQGICARLILPLKTVDLQAHVPDCQAANPAVRAPELEALK